ncbi:MAG: hypothetical protein OEY85_08740 [Rhodospirillales bacterium]|nr:hypothetical protein [Rhodospirillales bacterium]
MRKVIYFLGGTVADFDIPDDRFDEFSKHSKRDARHSEDDLGKARRKLEAFVQSNAETGAGPEEILAACFIWNFFNTHADDNLYIKGDVVIVDLNGDGETIEYASVNDIQLAPSH